MVIADQAYEANDFIQMIQDMGAMVVIPVRSNRHQQREYDYHWYKDRNLVEGFFNKIKQFHRMATGYEKLDPNFMSMLDLVCTIICLAWMLTGPRRHDRVDKNENPKNMEPIDEGHQLARQLFDRLLTHDFRPDNIFLILPSY